MALLTHTRFMEFEAEEEMQIQKLQWLKGLRAPPPQAPPKLDTQASTAQREGHQPGEADMLPQCQS